MNTLKQIHTREHREKQRISKNKQTNKQTKHHKTSQNITKHTYSGLNEPQSTKAAFLDFTHATKYWFMANGPTGHPAINTFYQK